MQVAVVVLALGVPALTLALVALPVARMVTVGERDALRRELGREVVDGTISDEELGAVLGGLLARLRFTASLDRAERRRRADTLRAIADFGEHLRRYPRTSAPVRRARERVRSLRP